MDESLRAQIEMYPPRLEGMIHQGRQLRDTLAIDPSGISVLAATRDWYQECGITINQLSGGSKAHWLARSFSEAFLMRSMAGSVVEDAAPAEIVKRVIEVLEQAIASLGRMRDDGVVFASSEAAPSPRRFEFVHNAELRPVIEQAYGESRRALDQGQYGLALVISCGILESIVTDALEYKGTSAGELAGWSFEARLAIAERAGLIRGGWVRLPPLARQYHDLTSADGEPRPDVTVSEREARQAGQVLQVVMRDLNPGR
jgi:hypothetical protein